MIQLKGGYTTEDPRLDRLPQFDERSRNYPIRQLVVDKVPRSYTWSCLKYLDQGPEGSCVGFGWGHELVARPKVISTIDYDFARNRIYKVAQTLDEWPGEDYEGTSVLAGAKAVQQTGYMGEYRWAFGLDDLIMAVGHAGPAILGVNWYRSMHYPDPSGLIKVEGNISGGHCILCNGVSLSKKLFRLHQSWGSDWGLGGDCFISFDDMDRLLKEDGEACIPVVRNFNP